MSLRKSVFTLSRRLYSTKGERFGNPEGQSGWFWEKEGVGMGGKDVGNATEIKLKDGVYKSKEFFGYNEFSYFDEEVDMMKDRLPQPDSHMDNYFEK